MKVEMNDPQELEPLMEGEQFELLTPSGPERQYCIFRTGRERFCFSVLDVEEVVEWPNLTRVPLAPSFLMGIFNLRGSIVPVVDIAFTEGRRSDLPPKHVVVASLKGEGDRDDLRIGIAVDEVIGTYSTSDPLLVDENGNGDPRDHYLGKSTPDWQGSFGASATILRNFEVGALFEYKFGNYTITNLTDAFRKANPVIGRNLQRAAAAEATLMNPASTPEQRLEAVRLWAYDLKALSPYDGMNQGENGKFLRFREVSVTYNVPSATAGRFGFSHLSLTAAARNIALWTPYSGVDPEINEFGRGGASGDLGGIDQNFGEGIDAFGFALPRRFTFTVRMGF